MILQTVELSPSQKAAIEETVGRKLQNRKTSCSAEVRRRSPAPRRARMRRNRCATSLYLLDPSQRRMSIEDCAAMRRCCKKPELQ